MTIEEGVVAAVDYEISNRGSEMSMTWREYIGATLDKVNDRYGKQLLLHLSKHRDRYWRPRELKEELMIELSEKEIHKNLYILAEAYLVERGGSDLQFRGLNDGTLNLILRSRFEDEISGFVPDLKKEFRLKTEKLRADKNRLQGMLNNLVGKFAELQLAGSFRSRKRFLLSDFFHGVDDPEPVNIIDVKVRVPLQRDDDKWLEIDVLAESSCGRMLAVEVKKGQVKTRANVIDDFMEKVKLLARKHPESKVVSLVLSVGGFTREALKCCEGHKVGTAERIVFF